MPKRTDRLVPFGHEIRQVLALKGLEPIATPERYRPLSDALIDLAAAALQAARLLEETQQPDDQRLVLVVQQAARLPELLAGREPDDQDA